MTTIDLLKIAVCVLFLLYSCRFDLRTRTVPNELWGVVFVAALPLVIADTLVRGSGYLLPLIVSVVGVYVVVYILFRQGAFGGADAKALIALAFILPVFPDIDLFGYELPLNGVPPLNIFAFSTLVNTVLLTIVVPLGILTYNLTTLSLKEIMENPLYPFIGYRCKISDLKGRHIKLIEDYVCEDGGIKKKFTKSGVVIDDPTMKRMEQLASEGLIGERVWVTPGLPFMIPITAGFVSAIIYGDLMLGIVMQMM